ncbi:MAG TPA: ATP-binding protein, partial [Candidatus Kapabacteria bacterium]|nr:ATP-binding protein [Candidatus Kapabacteria bacterium]
NTMMDAASLELATIDQASHSLRVILSIDRGVSKAAYSVPLDSPSSFGAWAALHGREVFLEDVETNFARYIRVLSPAGADGERARSLICVPMFTKGAAVGVMAVGSYRKRAFTTYHLDMMKSLGLYIAVALDNAEAYQKLDRALTELKSAQRQLLQAEKMSSLGLLTAGIAHEINNPINFVSANIGPLRRNLADVLAILSQYQELDGTKNLELAMESIRRDEATLNLDYAVGEISKLLDGIQEGASRTAEIVQGLRNFSRTDEQSLKLADLHQGIDSTLTLLHNKYKNQVDIVKEYGDIPEIECFLGQLNQVFMNILSNAIYAVSENGRGHGNIWIRTRQTIDNTIEIRFRDDGLGMPDDIRKKIFDPFFTTKDVGVGTGLGLSISYGIIEKHGGHINVESEPGKGTEFIITLPIKQPT